MKDNCLAERERRSKSAVFWLLVSWVLMQKRMWKCEMLLNDPSTWLMESVYVFVREMGDKVVKGCMRDGG